MTLEPCWCLAVHPSEPGGDEHVHIPLGNSPATNETVARVRVAPVPAGGGVPVRQDLGTVSAVGQPVGLEAWICFVVHCDWCGGVLREGESVWHFPVVAGVPTNRAIARAAFDGGWTSDGEGCWYCPQCHLFSAMCPACFVGAHGRCEGGRCACEHTGWSGSTTNGGDDDA